MFASSDYSFEIFACVAVLRTFFSLIFQSDFFIYSLRFKFKVFMEHFCFASFQFSP